MELEVKQVIERLLAEGRIRVKGVNVDDELLYEVNPDFIEPISSPGKNREQ